MHYRKDEKSRIQYKIVTLISAALLLVMIFTALYVADPFDWRV
jgi:hypothetical protein